MTSEPVLRATAESGDTIDDPSEDALFLMFEDIENGESDFLVVKDLGDPGGHTYAQSVIEEDGSYVVEYRDGDASRHYATTAPDLRTAHALIVGWAFDVPGWRGSTTWRRLTF
ncbi:MAG: hypothetical protein QM621_01975 [Aeromicrobium sp.]|uniref:hypothetical protein n=1 Tax=Aeromicrobium sp. TaxID=1871063 RepID=UPI0039E609E4